MEVAFAADAVHLRASGGPAGTSLALSRPAWSDLVARLKAGELDRPA